MKFNKALRIASIILSIPAVLVSAACSSSGSESPAASTPPASIPVTDKSISPALPEALIYADESYNGKELRMLQGGILQVGLNSNPTTGFKWELVQISDTAVLEKTGNIFETPMIKQQEGAPPIVGAGGKEIWSFKALKPGTAVISMEYSRPWEGGEKGINKFSLKVIVQ